MGRVILEQAPSSIALLNNLYLFKSEEEKKIHFCFFSYFENVMLYKFGNINITYFTLIDLQ